MTMKGYSALINSAVLIVLEKPMYSTRKQLNQCRVLETLHKEQVE